MSMDYMGQNSRITAHESFSWRRYSAVQLAIIICVAIGHISTMPLGPGNPEIARQFGYDPSWIGMNTLFMLSGYMALRSLSHHGSPLKLLKSRFAGIFPMLAIYTALIIFVIYPLLGQAAQSFPELLAQMSLYAADVISCVNPGRPLKGLLDDAHYSCVIAGAIWTFRWGAIAFIGLALAKTLNLLSNKIAILAMAVGTLSAYVLGQIAVINYGVDIPQILFAPLRLGSMFAIGMAGYAYRHAIKRSYAIAIALLSLTALHYLALPWTPSIEILTSLFWGYAVFLVIGKVTLHQDISRIPRGFAAAVFIFHWPVAQLLLFALPETGPISLITLALPVTLLVSALITFAYLMCAKAIREALAARVINQEAAS
jgi:hypothetical protein